MKQYVSIDKRSKKSQKEYYSAMRQTWGLLNPATRTAPNGKAYDRNKEKQARRRTDRKFSDEFDVGSFILSIVRRQITPIDFSSRFT